MVFGAPAGFSDKNFQRIDGTDESGICIAGLDEGAQAGSQVVRETGQVFIGCSYGHHIVLADDDFDRVSGVEAGNDFGVSGADGLNGFGHSGLFQKHGLGIARFAGCQASQAGGFEVD